MSKPNIEQKNIIFNTTDEIEGKVEAVFSVFNEIDSDGDVVVPGSVKSGYGDKGVAMVWAHEWKEIVGRGEIIQDNDKAIFKGQFIMETEAGRDAFHTVKAMADMQQWSFGYEVLDSELGKFKTKDGQEKEVRFLKELKVWEVSPVLVGANQNTYTLSVKSEKDAPIEEKEEVSKDTFDNPGEAQERAKELGCSGIHSVEQNGQTNFMPCKTHEEYEQVSNEPKGKRFVDEVSELRINLENVINRAKGLTSLRLEKNKQLSKEATEILVELADELQNSFADLTDLLDAGADDKTLTNTELDTELYNSTLKRTMEILTDTVDI
jgi:HK97 family phage prohead protease